MRRHARRGAAGRSVLIGIGVLLVVLWIVFRACTVVIGAGERGVVYSKSTGVRAGALDEGLHFVVPLVWEVQTYSVRSRTYTLGSKVLDRDAEIAGGQPVTAKSEDGQDVTLHVSVRFHLNPKDVWKLHRDIGEDYVVKIIKPQVRSDARMVVSEYPGVDIFSAERYRLQRRLNDRISSALASRYIDVEEVLVRNITFSPQFQHAIEQKQIAQQNALRMDYVVKKQEEEKKKAIILAKGEAEATKLKGHALASYPELVQWEYVHNLPDDVDVVVTDTDTIINLGELFKQPAAQASQ